MMIGKDVLDLGSKLGLSTISTGGGFDFSLFQVGEGGANFTVQNGTGEGLKSLDEEAFVVFCWDFEWKLSLEVTFASGRAALLALANPVFRGAVMYEALSLLHESKVDEALVSNNEFDDLVEAIPDRIDLTRPDAAGIVIKAFGGNSLCVN